ncbi:hypothetical protein MBLNU230_g1706t1 [Neophaeotheca triangularis]
MANNNTPAPPGNVLSAASISQHMAISLPQSADPQLRNTYDAIALAAHATMLAVGFRLVGLNEDHRLEAQANATETPSLPAEWNASSGSYSFRYAHVQSSLDYVLKVNRMGNKAVVMGMGIGDDRTCQFDITIQDYTSPSNLPLTPRSEGSDVAEVARKLVDVFISAGRLSDFGSLMRINVVQKLVPSLHKEGYEETQTSQSNSASTNRRESHPRRDPERPERDPLREDRDPPARPHPLHDPLAQGPRRPMPEPMPGFEDEFEAQRPLRGGVPGAGGFPRIGDRDLYPQGLGPNDPMRGGVGPGLGPMGGMGGGGMHPTFDDPLFAGQGQRGGGYDPRAPPGARFDPTGPGMGGGPGLGGHPRGAGMGGRPPNPFGGFGDGDFI